MRDQLIGLAISLVILGVVLPPIMAIPGLQYMLDILPYTIPMLIIGLVMLFRLKPEKEETPMPVAPIHQSEEASESPADTART